MAIGDDEHLRPGSRTTESDGDQEVRNGKVEASRERAHTAQSVSRRTGTNLYQPTTPIRDREGPRQFADSNRSTHRTGHCATSQRGRSLQLVCRQSGTCTRQPEGSKRSIISAGPVRQRDLWSVDALRRHAALTACWAERTTNRRRTNVKQHDTENGTRSIPKSVAATRRRVNDRHWQGKCGLGIQGRSLTQRRWTVADTIAPPTN